MQFDKTARLCAAGVLMLAAQAVCAQESGTWTVGAGFNYSSGKYGTATNTEITSIPFTAAYDKGPWTMKLTVPYIRITGSSDVVVGLGGARRRRGPAAAAPVERTDSGLGDIVAAATYNFYNNPAAQFGADITGKIKFGTADSDKNLGTGKNDYSVQLDLYKKLNQWTVFGGVGYAFLGSSDAIPLNNVFNAGVGTTYKISDKNSAGVAYDYRQRTSDTGFAQSELTAFVTHRFDKSWKAQAYLLKGFSDGSPDWGGGASIGYAF